jgi:hypothetical protein
MKCHFVPFREHSFCPVQKDRQYTYKVTLMRVRATNGAMGNGKAISVSYKVGQK